MFVLEKFGVLCFLEIAVLRFALLPFYRRNEIVRILQSVSDPSSNSLFSSIKSYLDCFKFVKKWVTSYHKLRENWICLKELVRNRISSSFKKRGLHFRCFWENFPIFIFLRTAFLFKIINQLLLEVINPYQINVSHI